MSASIDYDLQAERFNARPILLLVGVLFLTFLPRMLLSPLLLRMEQTFALSRAEGGALFLFISFGFSGAMLCSGFVAERLHHRGTIVLSLTLVGLSQLLLAAAINVLMLRLGFVLLGIGAGLYTPSGIATLTGVAHARHWGKALAMHEVGPVLGFFAAPLLVNVAVQVAHWRVLFALLGLVCLVMAPTYKRVARGGRFPGAAPKPRHLLAIARHPAFWVVALFFILAAGLEVGVYSMLPTFLIVERGMSEPVANTLVAMSRLTALLLVVGSGLLADRLGAKLLIALAAISSGLATLLIGASTGAVLVVAVFLQPMLVAAFFPPGFVMMASVATDETRNLVVAMVIPIAYLFGGGLVPTVIGFLAEHGRFGTGFVIVGALMMASTAMLRTLPVKPAA